MLFISSVIVLCILLALFPDNSAGTFYERVFEYMAIAFTLDFGGITPQYGEVLIDRILFSSSITFQLLFGAICTALIISVPLGIIAGLKPDGLLQKFVSYPMYLLSSVPVLIWLMLIVIGLNWSYIYSDLERAGFGESLLILFPPIFALAVGDGMLYETYRNVRTEVRSLILQPWIKGLKSRGRHLYGHIARGLVEPLFVTVSSKLTYLISGAIIVEAIFTWQGLGFTILDVIRSPARDYRLLIAAVMIVIMIVIAASILRDLISVSLNPHRKEEAV